jgi:hypothetical protein
MIRFQHGKREDEFFRLVFSYHNGRNAGGIGMEVGDKLFQCMLIWKSVVIHQPDRVETIPERVRDTPMPAPGRTDVFLRDKVNATSTQHLDGAVGAGIVDDQDRIWQTGLSLNVIDAAAQEVTAVVGDDCR